MISEVCLVSSCPSLARELDRVLSAERIVVESANRGEAAMKRALCGCSSALLIDDEPPDMSSADLLRRMRASARGRQALVILMSSRASELDRVIAFELGADDFIAKPIGVRELSLRLSAVLRRHHEGRRRSERFEVGPLCIDAAGEWVSCEGQRLPLTSVEFRLLEYLARNPGEVQERKVLLERVWRWCDADEQGAGRSRTVDTHVKRLREKLGPASELIETIRGVGYRLRPAS